MVLIRIISVSKDEFLFNSEITRYTNTQNSIEKRDFVALDPEQERIRQELFIDGIEYIYKAGTATGTKNNSFDLTEATIALACCSDDVSLAVQAKREISKLWEDIGKTPYKLLFNGKVNGPNLWQLVQILRLMEEEIKMQYTVNYTGRDSLICIHGNRFIEWIAFKILNVKLGTIYNDVKPSISKITIETIPKVITKIKSFYSDSYPASLFKNLGKCRDIAEKILS